jgi:hypothetical protein
MITETEQQHYRGVLCLHCSQPIAISPLLASREIELYSNETTVPKARKCQVFNLRCPACGKEKPYKIGEIRGFSGAAREIPRAMPAPAWSPLLGNKAKTANA